VQLRGPLPGRVADRRPRQRPHDPRRREPSRSLNFPDARDIARGVRLFFDDDTFVEPRGKAIVSNEEDKLTIVSVNIATHRIRHLAGIPGVKGKGPNELDWPDDAYVLPSDRVALAVDVDAPVPVDALPPNRSDQNSALSGTKSR
jgi:hypothetical protein